MTIFNSYVKLPEGNDYNHGSNSQKLGYGGPYNDNISNCNI